MTFVADVAVQGLLCGVLQVVIQKLSESDSAKTGLLEKADSIMQALLGVFQCDTTSVHEEAMLAVGALTYVCGQSFTKYMQSFYPVLELGLKNHRVGLLFPPANPCRKLFHVHVCVLPDAASSIWPCLPEQEVGGLFGRLCFQVGFTGSARHHDCFAAVVRC